MSIDPGLIEQLLMSDEDVTLDFKRDQYEFDGASKEAKSELLKDVLALANAFRRSDAYILVGVDEKRGGRSEVVGVASHLDDAKLQQFVNSKTQMPVTFSYHQAVHDNLPIGVIHIPLQSRPFYATSDYGKVRKELVYVRRGSSTAQAKPEEVIRMGAPAPGLGGQPSVQLHLVDRKTGRRIEQPLCAEKATWYEVPSPHALPDYPAKRTSGTGQMRLIPAYPWSNKDYYREVAAYVQAGACLAVSLELENTGGNVIHDARFVAAVRDPSRRLELRGPKDEPPQPQQSTLDLVGRGFSRGIGDDVHVAREGDDWRVVCEFGKVQPRSKVRLRDDLFIGSRDAGEKEIRGRIYGDNVSSPIVVAFGVSFAVGSKTLDTKTILGLVKRGEESE